jgi:Phytanoyl-CoA dioxygenase (PhyH)
MRRVLNDDQQESNFHRDGYVTIQLLDHHQLEALKQLIKQLNEGHIESSTEAKSSYKLSFFNNDLAFKQKVFETLTAFFQPLIDQHLYNYKPLIINIFDKEPGKGEVPVHQNWTFVDEDKYTSVSVWIPLVDVSHANGTLEVVKGSHKVLCKHRSPSLPWVFDELNDVLKAKYLQPFEFTAGHAAIIDDGILHWSSENNTPVVRTAVQLIMAPADADTIHLYKAPGRDDTQVYKVDPLFFMQYNMKDIPEGYNVIDRKDIRLKKLSESEFKKVVTTQNPEIAYI